MGHIYTNVQFEGNKGKTSLRTLIDTGATFITLPPHLAEEIGIAKVPGKIKLKLANGLEVETEAGSVIIEVQRRRVPATAVILPGSEPLLGAEALEALGLKPNPQTGELEPTRSYTLRA